MISVLQLSSGAPVLCPSAGMWPPVPWQTSRFRFSKFVSLWCFCVELVFAPRGGAVCSTLLLNLLVAPPDPLVILVSIGVCVVANE